MKTPEFKGDSQKLSLVSVVLSNDYFTFMSSLKYQLHTIFFYNIHMESIFYRHIARLTVFLKNVDQSASVNKAQPYLVWLLIGDSSL